MTELTRREKEAGIRPEPEVDLFMKVRTRKSMVTLILSARTGLSRSKASDRNPT